MTLMTQDEAAEAMRIIAENDDWESGHLQADDLMCDLLRALGYGDAVDWFEDMGKWYA